MTHLRELSSEEKEERIRIQKKQHEDMVQSEERFQKAAARLQAENSTDPRSSQDLKDMRQLHFDEANKQPQLSSSHH